MTDNEKWKQVYEEREKAINFTIECHIEVLRRYPSLKDEEIAYIKGFINGVWCGNLISTERKRELLEMLNNL